MKIATKRLVILIFCILICTLIRASRNQAWFNSAIPDYPVFRSFSLFLNPFRQAREVVDDLPRSEIGCENESGVFTWTPLNYNMMKSFRGSHTFTVLPYAIISNSYNQATYQIRKKWVTRFFCKPDALRTETGCASGVSSVSLRNRSIFGKVTRDETYACY